MLRQDRKGIGDDRIIAVDAPGHTSSGSASQILPTTKLHPVTMLLLVLILLKKRYLEGEMSLLFKSR
uniref:Uncharacterized protein n=1 Tax=Oryza meridionalis TaxID=40149 RepID=A0A0E0F459_9ORYZ